MNKTAAEKRLILLGKFGKVKMRPIQNQGKIQINPM
jgi:hypothetical protein